MTTPIGPLHLLIHAVAGWMNRARARSVDLFREGNNFAHLLLPACLAMALLSRASHAQSFDFGTLATGGVESPGFAAYGLAVRPDSSVWQWRACDAAGSVGSYPAFVTSNVVGIARKFEHTLAVMSDGTVSAWGNNPYGQLGNGTLVDSAVPVPVTGLSNIVAVAAGNYESLALTQTGTVWHWGSIYVGMPGQPGAGLYTYTTPVIVPGLASIVGIAAGYAHAAALRADGTVFCWGSNYLGQIAQAYPVAVSGVPTAVGGIPPIVGVSCDGDFCLALDGSGSVWGWGDNNDLQLARPYIPQNVYYVPAMASGLPPFVRLATGGGHGTGLTSTGQVWTWGYNRACQCGYPPTNPSAGVPAENPSPVGGLASAIEIAGGRQSTLVRLSDGTIWSWGEGFMGLGLPTPAGLAAAAALNNGIGPPNCTPRQMPSFGAGYMSSNTPASAAAGGTVLVQLSMPANPALPSAANLPLVVLVDVSLGLTPLGGYGTSGLAWSNLLFPLVDSLGAFGPTFPGTSMTGVSTDATGGWTWSLTYPPSPQLAGATLYVEGYALTGLAPNSFFLKTTNVATVSLY